MINFVSGWFKDIHLEKNFKIFLLERKKIDFIFFIKII